jgi:hypothetical protein
MRLVLAVCDSCTISLCIFAAPILPLMLLLIQQRPLLQAKQEGPHSMRIHHVQHQLHG